MTPSTAAFTVLADRYHLGDLIGRGGMGDVYCARDLRLGREVAVKVLRPEMARQPEIRSRFEAEALSAARLSHPNVVTVFDSGEDEGVPFIVMECLPGRTLATAMAAGPVDQAWLRHVALDVLGALGAAHAAGVIHRDVKPGNILLTDDGRAKVADFGIAKSLEPVGGTITDTTTGHLMLGTPAYLAPERIEGKPATAQSDLYSLGVVLYEALAGEKPFTADTPMAVAMAVVHDDPEPLVHRRPDVDPGLAVMVETAMQRDPSARFANAEDMARAVRAVAPTPGPEAELATIAEVPPADQTSVLVGVAPSKAPALAAVPLWVQRRRMALAAAAVGALVLVVLVAALAFGHDRSAVNSPSTSNTAPQSSNTTAPVVTAPPTTAQLQVQISVPAPVPGKGRGKHKRGNG
ncbi:MAG: serine/threonine protein kinase [Actinobacteria bacterium]|nr:serine/threonine protein kinase [Actinomycetota bacterium]